MSLKCEICGKDLEGKQAYQIRYGYVLGGEFYPEEDVAYRCEECGIPKYEK